MYSHIKNLRNYFNHQIGEQEKFDQQLILVDEAEKERIRKKRKDLRIKKIGGMLRL